MNTGDMFNLGCHDRIKVCKRRTLHKINGKHFHHKNEYSDCPS